MPEASLDDLDIKYVLGDTGGSLKAVKDGVQSFTKDVPFILNGLDEVAKIHPVVTGQSRK